MANKYQLVVQCTSTSLDWQPRITSTPQIRRPSFTVVREERIGMFQMSNCLKATPVPVEVNPSLGMNKNCESILSKSNTSKGKGILVSDSSSDEEEACLVNKNKKKLVIRINNSAEKPVDKKTLKINNLGKNAAVKNNIKINGTKVNRSLKSKNNLANISSTDKENVCNNEKDKSGKTKKIASKIPVKSNTVKEMKSLVKAAPQKRKSTTGNPKGKKSKVDEKPLNEQNIDIVNKSISSVLQAAPQKRKNACSPKGKKLKVDKTPPEAEEENINVLNKSINLNSQEKVQEQQCKKINPKEKKLKVNEKPLETKGENIDAVDKSRNSASHQLFSETREQEFLESLDLSAVDMEEPHNNSLTETNQKKMERKCMKRKIKMNKKESEAEKKKNEMEIKENETEIVNPSVPDDKMEVKVENPCAPKNNVGIKEVINPCAELQNCSVLSERPTRNRKPPKKFWLPNEKLNKVDKNKVDKNKVSSDISNQNSTPKRVKKQSNVEKQGSNPNYANEYFKNIKDLEYRKNPSGGYLGADCCMLPKFKSGVLRLGYQAEATSKTRGKNSVLGGVVLEGSIKMKIGDVEKDIQQGETIFVPPLTEWRAINLTEKESVIYYWCGLF